MTRKVWTLLLVMLLAAIPALAATVPAPPPAGGFTQAVIAKAISFMPKDLQTKLKEVEKEIIAGAKSLQGTAQPTKDACYFAETKEGGGPDALTEQFRAVRKKNAAAPTYKTLAPYLGKLAGEVIILCQPYHTSETALKDTAHAVFEKTLDTSAASLKADFDGSQKVTDPSDYAAKTAKSASELLTKAKSSEADSQSEAKSGTFSLAANSVADCWWTLLSAEKPQASGESGDASSAATGGNFIGNARSLKFHSPDCRYLPAEKNRVYFQTREDAINQGFVPCKVCKP